jgi:hypothetical protein
MTHDADKAILKALTAPFEASELRKKGKFSYIPEPVVRNRLQEVLGLDWDFEITNETITKFKDKEAIVVKGRLSAALPSGRTVVREGFGGSLLSNGMTAGDGHKSAASNALKKAAYLLGVGAYLGLDGLESIDDTTQWGSPPAPAGGNSWGGQPQQAPAQGNQSWGNPPAPNQGSTGGWS